MKNNKTIARLVAEAKQELGEAHRKAWSLHGAEAERIAKDKPWLHPHQVARYLALLGPEETRRLLETTEEEIMKTIRTNTVKTTPEELAEKLRRKGFKTARHPYIGYGLQILYAPYSPGAAKEYLQGLYTIQGPASMLAVPSMKPEELPPKPLIIDMCSGAGIKTTQLAQHRPDATIIALDINPRKLAALRNNASRLGYDNIAALLRDARNPPMPGRGYDAVLLDAPCSGEGLLPFPRGRWPRSFSDIVSRVELQLQLLWAGVEAAKPGAPILYATCSISVEENEYVVSKILGARSDVDLEEPGVKAGDEGYTEYLGLPLSPKARLCRRFYPHRHRTEGFTICLLRKRRG